jgi:hypothetical protein
VGSMSRMSTALLWVAAIFLIPLTIIVVGNDMGSRIEVPMLNGTPVQATPTHVSDIVCDTMYHAEWIARHTPAHSAIVDAIKTTDCPW